MHLGQRAEARGRQRQQVVDAEAGEAAFRLLAHVILLERQRAIGAWVVEAGRLLCQQNLVNQHRTARAGKACAEPVRVPINRILARTVSRNAWRTPVATLLEIPPATAPTQKRQNCWGF